MRRTDIFSSGSANTEPGLLERLLIVLAEGDRLVDNFAEKVDKNEKKSLADAVFEKAEMPHHGVGQRRLHGSHGGGLDYVPFDGYVSQLHRGEAVLTADQAKRWRSGGAGGVTIVQNINSVPQTPVQLAAATAAYFERARW